MCMDMKCISQNPHSECKFMQRTHKIRLYPTAAQEVLLRNTAGAARFAYNWALEKWKGLYEQYKNGEIAERPNVSVVDRLWTKTRPAWALETNRCSQQHAIANLSTAFGNMWRGKGNYPKFHKKGGKDSFYVSNDKAHIRNRRITLPKIGSVRMAEDLRYTGKIMSYTVTHYAGQWHVSVQVDTNMDVRPVCANPDSVVGIDVGLRTPATVSDGTRLVKPTRVTRLRQQLKRLQRVLARKKPGSNNKRKTLLRKQKIQLKINNIRNDVSHKFTTTIAKSHGIVVTEDLNARGMQHTGNKAVRVGMDSSMMSTLIRLLSYKVQTHILADKFFPSTKKCSSCGYVRDSIALGERKYVCPHCGLFIDRDLNAAINLMRYTGQVMPGAPVNPSAYGPWLEAGSNTPF